MMDKILFERWLDALIDYWYTGRMLRTLSTGGGSKIATDLSISGDSHIHLSMDEHVFLYYAKLLGVEAKKKDHTNKFDEIGFIYKNFYVFILTEREGRAE